MPRKTAKAVQLDPEDMKALERAEADGARRPPKITVLVSMDSHLGEESELYRDFRD